MKTTLLWIALLASCHAQIYNPGTGGGGSGTVTSVDGSAGNGVESIQSGTVQAITTSGTLRGDERVNAQTGTTYTLLTGDRGKLVTQTNASAIADTLPQAGASFPSGWYVDIQNRGAGTITITPTTSTIDGAATLALTTNQGVRIASDGTNYFTQRGVGGASGGTPGGSNTQVQYNNSGSFAGSSGITLTGTQATITAPKIDQINDTSFNKQVIAISADTAAVNYYAFNASPTTSDLVFSAAGSDTNIGLQWLAKGNGVHRFSGDVIPYLTNTNSLGSTTGPKYWTAAYLTSGGKFSFNNDTAISRDSSGGSGVFDFGTGAADSKAGTLQFTHEVASSYADWGNISKPSNPASGSLRLYYKTSTGLCQLDSAGTETCFGTGTGTVTVVGAGTLTSTAIATGGGSQTIQTPSATSTLDSSGNASFAGSVHATTSISSGTAPASAGSSATGGMANTESASTGWTPTAGEDYIRADDTLHQYVVSNNGGAEVPLTTDSGLYKQITNVTDSTWGVATGNTATQNQTAFAAIATAVNAGTTSAFVYIPSGTYNVLTTSSTGLGLYTVPVTIHCADPATTIINFSGSGKAAQFGQSGLTEGTSVYLWAPTNFDNCQVTGGTSMSDGFYTPPENWNTQYHNDYFINFGGASIYAIHGDGNTWLRVFDNKYYRNDGVLGNFVQGQYGGNASTPVYNFVDARGNQVISTISNTNPQSQVMGVGFDTQGYGIFTDNTMSGPNPLIIAESGAGNAGTALISDNDLEVFGTYGVQFGNVASSGSANTTYNLKVTNNHVYTASGKKFVGPSGTGAKLVNADVSGNTIRPDSDLAQVAVTLNNSSGQTSNQGINNLGWTAVTHTAGGNINLWNGDTQALADNSDKHEATTKYVDQSVAGGVDGWVKASTPVFTPSAGSIMAGSTVAVTCAAGTVYCLTVGTDPSTAGTSDVLTSCGALTVSSNGTLYGSCRDPKFIPTVASAAYTTTSNPTIGNKVINDTACSMQPGIANPCPLTGFSVTAGQASVIGILINNDASDLVTGVSGSTCGTYTRRQTSTAAGPGMRTYIYTAQCSGSGTETISITYTGAPSFFTTQVGISNLSATPYVVGGTNTSTSTNPTVTTASGTVTNGILIGYTRTAVNSDMTPGAGFTDIGGTMTGVDMEYKLVNGTSTTYTANWSALSDTWLSLAVALTQ